VNELAAQAGYDMRCFHVPKTVDNALVGSDHTPGFASAARFNALAFMADSLDNASLPGVKINVVMGRHAGWIALHAGLWSTLELGPFSFIMIASYLSFLDPEKFSERYSLRTRAPLKATPPVSLTTSNS
jgi:6-phosphofructokinase